METAADFRGVPIATACHATRQDQLSIDSKHRDRNAAEVTGSSLLAVWLLGLFRFRFASFPLGFDWIGAANRLVDWTGEPCYRAGTRFFWLESRRQSWPLHMGFWDRDS